jgi:hypothetical protein
MSQVLAPALDLLIKYFGNIVRTRFRVTEMVRVKSVRTKDVQQ